MNNQAAVLTAVTGETMVLNVDMDRACLFDPQTQSLIQRQS